MKKLFSLVLLLTLSLVSLSCFEDFDDNPIFSNLEVKDFVWKGLNSVYLYKPEVPDLANDRFSSDEEYTQYLNGFDSPESLFESLKYEPLVVDRFSRIYSDYFALEQLLQGTGLQNGMRFKLYQKPNTNNEVFGVIYLILPNSSASINGLERGMMFDKVDGMQLYYNTETDNNFNLFNSNSYSISLATYDTNGTAQTSDDSVNPTGETVNLTKTAYNENPVYHYEVINVNGGEKLGYLMYNNFFNEYDNQLNDAFASFQSNGVQHLVLDLRYNGGGSVQTAAYLGSMVTGQFNGQVFAKILYNENLANNNTNYNFTNSIDGGGSINSLNLNKVYVITTGDTASASEMIINSLKEYISVVQIGNTTVGKSQSSSIVYDSPQLFNRTNVNPNHTYAMLPLIGITVNANDGQVPPTGIVPETNNQINESINNLGVIGNPNERLLAKVIEDIENNRMSSQSEYEGIYPVQVKLPEKPTDFILLE